MRTNVLVNVAVAFLVLAGTASAQNSGKIAGKLTDAETGEPLVGAHVMINGTTYGAETDLEGEYAIIKIASGVYSLTASSIGYTSVQMKNVQVLNDLTTRMDFRLSSSAIALTGEIVVVAEKPMIRKDVTATESRMTAEEIKNLPVMNLGQIVTLQAGVSRDAEGGLHIRGGRSSEISYLVNGVSVTDDYSHSQALTIEPESVQELQIVSGTFNAEYGNAMSGVINVVTKSGTSTFQGNVEAWTGDYVSNHTDIFWGIDRISPSAMYNLQGSLGGPVISDRATFFASIRRFSNEGYIFGINTYLPQGRTQPGDGSSVSMNSRDRWSGQCAFEWQFSGALKAKVDALGSTETSRAYNHFYRMDPYGIGESKARGVSVISRLTHQFAPTTFQEVTLAYKYNDVDYRLYDDPYDPRYVHPDSTNVPGYHFAVAGTDLSRFNRSTQSLIAKWELTTQLNKINLVKTGAEVQWDKLYYDNVTLVPALDANGQQIVPFQPAIEDIDKPTHDRFERTPVKVAAYVQDKIELESMIINVGFRYELFDPHGRVPSDPSDPNIYNPAKLENIYHDTNNDGAIGLDEQTDDNRLTVQEREAYWYKAASKKSLISPRFGIAYPITDRGIIRFSYGIFQQIPDYSQLYLGDQYKLTSAQGIQGPFGNNDLKPQRTTIYEIGLQQQLSADFAMDITGFYRDIRDWISSSQPIPTFLAGISYSQRTNRDFANVRGVTLSLTRRYADYVSFGIDYTYQVADGTNSSPDQEYFAQLNGAEPTRTLTPLDWDQRHTLNGHLLIGGTGWGVSLIGTFSAGQPYTPTIVAGANTGRNVLEGLPANSRQKPNLARLDCEVYKSIGFLGPQFLVFLRVLNVFDAKNPIQVFSDTGKPDFTLQQQQVSDYDPGWFTYPTYYSEPRSLTLGLRISL